MVSHGSGQGIEYQDHKSVRSLRSSALTDVQLSARLKVQRLLLGIRRQQLSEIKIHWINTQNCTFKRAYVSAA
jgi:hypothetical protein